MRSDYHICTRLRVHGSHSMLLENSVVTPYLVYSVDAKVYKSVCLFGNSLGNKQSLSVLVIFIYLTNQRPTRFARRRLQACGFCSLHFKMDVVPEDVEYSETHRQNYRDRTASLNSTPQRSTANFGNSTLRIRNSIASMKSNTCVYSMSFL